MRLVSVPMLALMCFTASSRVSKRWPSLVSYLAILFIDVVVKFVDQQIQPVHLEDKTPAEDPAAVPSPAVLVRHPAGRFHFVHMVAGVILVDQIEEWMMKRGFP